MAFSEVVLPSNRKFGLFFSAMLAILGVFLFRTVEYVSYLLLAIAAIFLLFSLIKPSCLLLFNRLWMAFGLLLGKLISPIIIGIIFFGLFTPISIVMKIFGRDELRLKIKDRSSHWKLRERSLISKDSFKQQF